MTIQKLRVWWIPQIPMKPFHVDVDTVDEGVKILDVLANYDLFQLEHNIKPDFANAGGLAVLDEDGEWVDWADETHANLDDYTSDKPEEEATNSILYNIIFDKQDTVTPGDQG